MTLVQMNKRLEDVLYERLNGRFNDIEGQFEAIESLVETIESLEGLSAYTDSTTIAVDKLLAFEPGNPAFNMGPALAAAMVTAAVAGKTLYLGSNTIYCTTWTAPTITGTLRLVGNRAKIVGPATIARFANMQAGLYLSGVDFHQWQDLFYYGTNIDLSEQNLEVYQCNQTECYSLLYCTNEYVSVRDIIVDQWSNVSEKLNGFGRGQGLRWQTANYRQARVSNFYIKNKNFQGLRIGAFPHDVMNNAFIWITNGRIEGVTGNGQQNGLQTFGNNVYVKNVYITDVYDLTGASSNVEPIYSVGNRVLWEDIDIVNAGGAGQGSWAIKSSNTKATRIRTRTRLSHWMGAWGRVDGDNLEITDSESEWLWNPVGLTTGDGAAYTVTSRWMDSLLNRNSIIWVVFHTINTTTTPTLNGKTIVVESDNSAPELGQIRPGAVYRCKYNETNDRWTCRAQALAEQTDLLTVTGSNVAFDITDASGNIITTPVDGAIYQAAFKTTPPSGALNFVMNNVSYPVKRMVSGSLVNLSGQISNNYPRSFYYDATNGCFVLLYGSGKEDVYARYVLELPANADAYVFPHPYPKDYADSLFCVFPETNVGDVSINVDGTVRSVLTSSGVQVPASNLVVGDIYSLLPVSGNYQMRRIGRQLIGIDCLGNRFGRYYAENLRFINTQYQYEQSVDFSTSAQITGHYYEGRNRCSSRIYLNAPTSVTTLPNTAHVTIRDVRGSHFALDAPSSIISTAARTGNTEIYDVAAADVRGGTVTSATVVTGYAVSGAMGNLKLRNVKAATGYNLITNPSYFAKVDNDAWYRVNASFNPPSLAANTETVYGTTYTIGGAAVGDIVSVTHTANNTRMHFKNSYVSAANTVTVVATNPTGSVIDLDVGELLIQVLKPSVS